MKQVWHTSVVAIIILITFILGEYWHLADESGIHYFLDGKNSLTNDYFELFRNRNVNWFLYSVAVFISAKYNNWEQTKWIYFILIFYFIADTCLYYYNNNTKYESIIYIVCGLLDFVVGLGLSVYLWIKNKRTG
jgi:hypothetical protein